MHVILTLLLFLLLTFPYPTLRSINLTMSVLPLNPDVQPMPLWPGTSSVETL